MTQEDAVMEDTQVRLQEYHVAIETIFLKMEIVIPRIVMNLSQSLTKISLMMMKFKIPMTLWGLMTMNQKPTMAISMPKFN